MQQLVLLVATIAAQSVWAAEYTARGGIDEWSTYRRYEFLLSDTDALLHLGDGMNGGMEWRGNENTTWSRICNGTPAIITNSLDGRNGNGACSGDGNPLNTTLSCSCLHGFDKLDVWKFRIKAPEQNVGIQPRVLSNNSVLGVNKIDGLVPWKIKDLYVGLLLYKLVPNACLSIAHSSQKRNHPSLLNQFPCLLFPIWINCSTMQAIRALVNCMIIRLNHYQASD